MIEYQLNYRIINRRLEGEQGLNHCDCQATPALKSFPGSCSEQIAAGKNSLRFGYTILFSSSNFSGLSKNIAIITNIFAQL